MKILVLAIVVSLSLLILTIALLYPTESRACTCVVLPLAKRYEQASVVFVARVGARRDQFDELGNKTPEWPFEVDEVLKGDVTFEVLTPGGCGWGVAPGEKYLLFSDKDGAVGTCTAGRLSQSDRYRADLDVLRSYRDGDSRMIAEPWVFGKRAGKCRLSLDMAVGHGSLIFEYRFADATTPDFRGEQFRYDINEHRTVTLKDIGRHPAYLAGFRRLRIWYPYYRYIVEGTGRLLIGDEEWPTEHEVMEVPVSPFEVVTDAAFSEALAALRSHDSVALAAEYTDFPYNPKDYPDFPVIKATTPYSYGGTAIEDFGMCVHKAGQ